MKLIVKYLLLSVMNFGVKGCDGSASRRLEALKLLLVGVRKRL